MFPVMSAPAAGVHNSYQIPTKAAQGSALWSQGGDKGEEVLEKGKFKAIATLKKPQNINDTLFGIDFLNQFSYY